VFAKRCPEDEIHFPRGALDVQKKRYHVKRAKDGFLYCNNWMTS
jgi:hypothetical protein